MRPIWFKKRYVEAILSGEKTDTIRAKRPWCKPGDIGKAQVAYQPAFAEIEIIDVTEVDASSVDPERLGRVEDIYGRGQDTYWLIKFSVTKVLKTDDRPAGARGEPVQPV